MPGAVWFPDVALSYPEHIFRGKDNDALALQHASELRELGRWTWGDLRAHTARVRIHCGSCTPAGRPDPPKAIVHGHGGILLEHLKALHLHVDQRAGDNVFWFTTTGWMMWNFLISAVLTPAAVVLLDGNPGHPDMGVLWDLAERAQVDLLWHRRRLRPGGTDGCTAFVGGCPILPVHVGELQARALGVAVEAFDDDGRSVVDEVGELVVTDPMPSMPVGFWNEPGDERYSEAYFSTFPGVWRHGDWIRITARGSAVIYGR